MNSFPYILALCLAFGCSLGGCDGLLPHDEPQVPVKQEYFAVAARYDDRGLSSHVSSLPWNTSCRTFSTGVADCTLLKGTLEIYPELDSAAAVFVLESRQFPPQQAHRGKAVYSDGVLISLQLDRVWGQNLGDRSLRQHEVLALGADTLMVKCIFNDNTKTCIDVYFTPKVTGVRRY